MKSLGNVSNTRSALSLIVRFMLSLILVAELSGQNLAEDLFPANVVTALDATPRPFEQNLGQEDPAVRFLLRNPDYSLFMTEEEAVLAASDTARIRMRMVGNQTTGGVGLDRLAANANYFLGNDPARWLRDIPTFGGVRYGNVYPGVDLIYRTEGGQLRAQLEIAPTASAEVIRLQFSGSTKLAVTDDGQLIVSTNSGEVHLEPPSVLEVPNGGRRRVVVRYVLAGNDQVGLKIEPRDSPSALTIRFGINWVAYLYLANLVLASPTGDTPG